MTITTSGPISGPPVVTSGPVFTTNYADLLVNAGEYSGRNDAAAMFPLLLRLAEAKLNRNLRTGYQETTTSLPVVDGVATLPSDFLEARAYVAYDTRQTEFVVSGNTIESLGTPWSGDLTLTYYAKLPPLSPTNPTNWLLDLDPNVYLYALVVEIAIWAKDVQLGQAAESMRDSAISTIMLNDENARWGRSRVVNRDLTP
jgi:hypothetical protein